DFTVIGSAANLSARLSDQCKVLDQSLLLSGAVQRALAEDLTPLGQYELCNVPEPTEIYTIEA
ncbi:MAG: adenylate/guanylate cyclase domain-containing protein, partial [Alphaproteobacteria bacterium]